MYVFPGYRTHEDLCDANTIIYLNSVFLSHTVILKDTLMTIHPLTLSELCTAKNKGSGEYSMTSAKALPLLKQWET